MSHPRIACRKRMLEQTCSPSCLLTAFSYVPHTIFLWVPFLFLFKMEIDIMTLCAYIRIGKSVSSLTSTVVAESTAFCTMRMSASSEGMINYHLLDKH